MQVSNQEKTEIMPYNSTGKIHNFGAGPSILPKEVFEEASRALINFNNSGLSILEIGHRTKLFQPVIEEAIQTLKERRYTSIFNKQTRVAYSSRI